jgi:hypothetical protein
MSVATISPEFWSVKRGAIPLKDSDLTADYRFSARGFETCPWTRFVIFFKKVPISECGTKREVGPC